MTRFVGSVVAIQATAAALLGVALWFFAAPIAGWMGMSRRRRSINSMAWWCFWRPSVASCTRPDSVVLAAGRVHPSLRRRHVTRFFCCASSAHAPGRSRIERGAVRNIGVGGEPRRAQRLSHGFWRQRRQHGADPNWRPPALADMFSMGRAAGSPILRAGLGLFRSLCC